jgi:hypothetical protein
MPAIDNNIAIEHWVATANLDKVKGAIEKLQRKAQRHNLPEPSLSISDVTRIDKVDVFEDGELIKKDFPVKKTMVEVTGVFPRFSDYQFLAKIDHVTSKSSNIVLTPGQQFEAELIDSGKDFHKCDSGCDHCGVNRQRNETFIVKNVNTNKMLQVGSSCVDDYVGSKTLPQLMAAFDINSIMYNVNYFDEMNNEYARGASHNSIPARLFLALAVEDTDNSGFRASRSEYPTWRHVNNCLYDASRVSYSGDEKGVIRAEMNGTNHPALEKADKVYEWLMAKDPLAQKSLFVRNLQAILDTGMFDPVAEGGKWAAMVASIPNSYNKELALVRDKGKTLNEPFGDVKKRGRLKLTVRNLKESDEYEMYSWTKVSLVDDEGRKFAWKASGGVDLKIGSTYLMTGTIKTHSEFQGIHYTHLSRCADFEKVEPDAPVPDFSAKIKPSAKPKIMLDDASISKRLVPNDLEHQITLFRTWKEGRTSYLVNSFVTITEDTSLDDISKQLIDEVGMESSVHLLARMKAGKDDVLDDVLAFAKEKIAALKYPKKILGQVSEDVDVQALSMTYKKEYLSTTDVLLPTKLISPEQVGVIDNGDIEVGRRITQFEHEVEKTLVLSPDEFELLGDHFHPQTRLLEKIKAEGYGRVVVDNGIDKKVYFPVNASDRLGIPNGVNILHREFSPQPEVFEMVKGKKAFVFTSDSEVDVSAAALNLFTEHVKSDPKEHILIPDYSNIGKNVNDGLSTIMSSIDIKAENELEPVAIIGVYPDMLKLLREAGLDARHIHVKTGDVVDSAYLSKLSTGADLVISLPEGEKLSEVIADYSDKVKMLVETFPKKRPEALLSNDMAKKMVIGCEALMDTDCSPLRNWGGERVNRITEALLDDVANSITGKPVQEAVKLFSFSDEAKVYAASFVKNELDVDVSFEVGKPQKKIDDVTPEERQQVHFKF